MKNHILMLFIPFILITCSNKRNCNIERLERLYVIEGSNNGVVSFQHILIAEGVDKGCADSAYIIGSLEQYMDGIIDKKPVSSIKIFNSKRHFLGGETISQPKSIYKDCIVAVWYDTLSGKPNEFHFYNSSGDKTYEGPNWNQ